MNAPAPSEANAEANELLSAAIAEWCPSGTFPRRVGKRQRWTDTPAGVLRILQQHDGTEPGYVSVYGFPRGHPRSRAIPEIDTLFIDMDIPSSGAFGRPEPGVANPDAWTQDMTELLFVVRRLASALVKSGHERYMRASLSGYKGVHLYVDFEALPATLGTDTQYKRGLSEFAAAFIDQLSEETGLDLHPWVDVDSSDLARLTRMPNTCHEKATAAFDERRYCVPVSLSELTTLTPSRYVELTSAPRAIPENGRRVPSPNTQQYLIQYVANAARGMTPHAGSASADGPTATEYAAEALDVTVADIPSLLAHKPCLLAFCEREDCYAHGDESHQMKLALLIELVNRNVPVDVILEFLDATPNHNPVVTTQEVNAVLRYGYRPYNHETMWQKMPTFCDPDICALCRDTEPGGADPHSYSQ